MDDLIFATVDGKEIGKLGTVSELELTADKDTYDDYMKRVLSYAPVEIQGEFESGIDIMRLILPQGLYNGYVLKRDDYLSPKNGWINHG